MTLSQHTNKSVHLNTLQQFYIRLYNHQNKLIPEQHAGDRNPLLALVCDLQIKHATTWRNTQLLQTHPFSPLQYRVGYQNINLTSHLIRYVQTTTVLPVYNN